MAELAEAKIKPGVFRGERLPNGTDEWKSGPRFWIQSTWRANHGYPYFHSPSPEFHDKLIDDFQQFCDDITALPGPKKVYNWSTPLKTQFKEKRDAIERKRQAKNKETKKMQLLQEFYDLTQKRLLLEQQLQQISTQLAQYS
jgi:hypothetical protein